MVLLLTFLLVAAPTEFLVLKNGKVISCDRHERSGSQVHVMTAKNTFSLPEKLVDWAASEEKTRQHLLKLEASKQASIPAKENTPAEEDRQEERAPIILTSREYQQIASPRESGEAVVPYRRIGNSIIVDVVIHGQGPYQMLLDTGASLTVVAPQLAASTGLRRTGETVNIVGVGGEAITTDYCMIDEISLGGARVQGLKVSIQGIPQLNNLSVMGLLGQDFLNHFVMNLDSSNNTIKLTPHTRSADFSGAQERRREILRNPQEPFQKLAAAYRDIGSYYQAWFNGQKVELRAIKDTISRLQTSKNEAREIFSAFNGLSSAELDPNSRQKVADFLRCYPDFEGFQGRVESLALKLRSAFSAGERSESTANSLREADKSISQALDRYRQCSGQ